MRMIRWLLWIAGGLVLGGLVHLASIMWLPRTATQDAYARLASLAPVNEEEDVTAADRLIVESPTLTGLIVARAFSPEPSLLPTATASLTGAQCRPQ
jgi:uncharacterized membrane protein